MPEEPRCWADLEADNARLRVVNAKLVAELKATRNRLSACAAAHGNDAEAIEILLAPTNAAIAAAEGDA